MVPGSGRSSGGGHGNPLQYSCLENPHGQRSPVSYSSWACKELDMTETTEHAHRVITVGGLFSLHLGFLVLFYLFFLKIIVFVLAVLGLQWCMGFYLAVESGGYSAVVVCRLLMVVAFLAASFSSCSTWAQYLWLPGSRVQAQWSWHIGLVAPWHVGSSRIRD